MSGLIWVQTVWKCYHQVTLEGKELKPEACTPDQVKPDNHIEKHQS